MKFLIQQKCNKEIIILIYIMVILRNKKNTDIKKIYFSKKIKIEYYFLSIKEKNEKKEIYKNIMKKINLKYK
tara:strand:- start:106 stop:321 length:216 start_codon:yes stop_codon:yes gene_type:complete